MSDVQLELKESHRRLLGSVIRHMRDVMEDLRRCGVPDDLFEELEHEIRQIEDTTHATPLKSPYLVEALLTRLWVDACGLGAANVESYGALGDVERGYFNGQAKEIERCVHALTTAIGGGTETSE